MKIKTPLFIVILLIVLTFVLRLYQKEEIPHLKNIPQNKTKEISVLGEEIIQENITKLAKKINIVIAKEEVFKKLSNYSIDVKDLEINLSKKEIISQSLTLTKKLTKCISKNYCGTTPDDDDGYFDEHATPAHSILKRSLQLLALESEEDNEKLNDLPFEALLEIENQDILEATASLLLKSDLPDEQFEQYLKDSFELEGSNKEILFFTLIRDADEDQRKRVIEILAKQFKEATPYSIVAFFQKINTMNLSSDELIKLAAPGCRLKEENEVSWNSFSFNLNKYIKAKKLDITIEDICF